MTVCDRCKNLKAKCFEVKIPVIKLEQSKAAHGRMIEKTVITVDMDLCDSCITEVCKDLGSMKTRIKNTEA